MKPAPVLLLLKQFQKLRLFSFVHKLVQFLSGNLLDLLQFFSALGVIHRLEGLNVLVFRDHFVTIFLIV